MKKPTKPLRARALDNKKLEKASGGRGVVHGYIQCDQCGNVTDTFWGYCEVCGKPFVNGAAPPARINQR